MIENFPDAFEYVNQRYVFNAENYPVMAKMTEQEKTIFALKHGLLHMLKSVGKLHRPRRYKIFKDPAIVLLFAQPDDGLKTGEIELKKAIVKMAVNILSICNTVGFTKESLASYQVPDEAKMEIINMPIEDVNPVLFKDHVQYFIEQMAILLEYADHTNNLNMELASNYVEKLYLCMLYWFDDSKAGILSDIPTVMKSK